MNYLFVVGMILGMSSAVYGTEVSCIDHLGKTGQLDVRGEIGYLTAIVPFAIGNDFIPEVPYPTRKLIVTFLLSQCISLASCELESLSVSKVSVNGLAGSALANAKFDIVHEAGTEILRIHLSRTGVVTRNKILDFFCGTGE